MGNTCCSIRRRPLNDIPTPECNPGKDSEDWDDQDADAQQICLPAVSQCRGNTVSRLVRLSQTNPDFRLLDVGCGNGLITVDLARAIGPSARVVGLDISGAILETAKTYAVHTGVENIRFVTGDAHRLPFRNAEFDAVHTHHAVAHFQDPVGAIRELARVTSPGGLLCLREGNLQTAVFSPGYDLLDECFKIIVEVHERSGGSSMTGDMLAEWSLQAGLPQQHMLRARPLWQCNTSLARWDFGGPWPARCTSGNFADMARKIGVTR